MTLKTETPTGIDALYNPSINKGTAFTPQERSQLKLRGLLPPRIFSQDKQVERVLETFRHKSTPLEKYIYLMSLQDRNEQLFFRVMLDHMQEIMPIVYTPTVGQACQEYGHIFRRPRGLFISIEDAGHVREIVSNWYHDDVRVVVVSDGERILGLGDLGANGMGIPVGKLALYTGCAGIHPDQCLPVMIDVGTENKTLLEDPMYIGLPQHRVRGEAYDALFEEFVQAMLERYPKAIIQLEDFGNANAFRLLQAYRNRICTFDDDIQGTASVVLSAIYGAMKMTQGQIAEQNILIFGAGEAGIGTAELMTMAMERAGLTHAEAHKRLWFVDSKGLIVASRDNLTANKRLFAQDAPQMTDLLDIVKFVKPTALIGVSGQANVFDAEVLQEMARLNPRPIVFALSNPTSKSECTAEFAFEHTQGRVIFASGSPFPAVTYNGTAHEISQANNAYIFPGVGLGVMATGAKIVTDDMFFVAAQTLSDLATPEDFATGRLFPSFDRIREVSAKIALSVAQSAYADNLATEPMPKDLPAYIESLMYIPKY